MEPRRENVKNKQSILGAMVLATILGEVVKMAEAEEKKQAEPAKPELTKEQSNRLILEAATMAVGNPGIPVNLQDDNTELAEQASRVLSLLNVEHYQEGGKITAIPTGSSEAEQLAEEFLPQWAIGKNGAKELVPGAQLLTKDGRRVGNAYIIHAHLKDYGGAEKFEVFCCITDMGHLLQVTRSEIDELFYVGDYLADPAEVLARHHLQEGDLA